MYLAIFEDGTMGLLDELTDSDIEASDDGYMVYIDVAVADQPKVYNEGGWFPILEWEK